jgi:signal transduction histidine kinase
MQGASPTYRVLVIDDNPSIHADLRRILGGGTRETSALDALESALFDTESSAALLPSFAIDSAYQGQEGLQRVEEALAANDPYALAFVDVRMPPGWDGIETIERIWQIAPDLHVTICTAYTDYSWDEIAARLRHSDRLLILRKPFDIVEARQIAACMAAKWTSTRAMERQVEELGRLAEERAKAAARAKELVELQARFVAQASHEIRTPLATVFATVETLFRYGDRLTPEQREQRLAKIRAQIAGLTALLDEVLAIRRIEVDRRQGEPEHVDVALLCREIAEQVDASGESAERVVIVATPGEPVRLAPRLVREIVRNLLANALKFSPDGSPVRLEMIRSEDRLTLRVEDRGIGIPPEDQAKLFEPFQRAGNAASVPGSGLGMTIVRTAAEQLGGRIGVTSRLGEGTTVEVVLPLEQGAADRGSSR